MCAVYRKKGFSATDSGGREQRLGFLKDHMAVVWWRVSVLLFFFCADGLVLTKFRMNHPTPTSPPPCRCPTGAYSTQTDFGSTSWALESLEQPPPPAPSNKPQGGALIRIRPRREGGRANSNPYQPPIPPFPHFVAHQQFEDCEVV